MRLPALSEASQSPQNVRRIPSQPMRAKWAMSSSIIRFRSPCT